jgi:hypothetical protein
MRGSYNEYRQQRTMSSTYVLQLQREGLALQIGKQLGELGESLYNHVTANGSRRAEIPVKRSRKTIVSGRRARRRSALQLCQENERFKLTHVRST